MQPLIHKSLIGLTALTLLLSGCNDDSKTRELENTVRRLQEKEAQKEAEEAQKRQLAEEQARKNELDAQIQDAFEEGKAAAKAEMEDKIKAAEQKRKAAEQKAKETEKKKQEASKNTEKLARIPALVITPTGDGQVNLRGAPNTSALVIKTVYDSDVVLIVATTNSCQTSKAGHGCWVKVKTEDGSQGYILDAYLQRR